MYSTAGYIFLCSQPVTAYSSPSWIRLGMRSFFGPSMWVTTGQDNGSVPYFRELCLFPEWRNE